jgi:cobalt-zinc-cadmium efflux system outer membrane protein
MLTMAAAVRYALENNPGLAAQRQQRGIAAARVVIADTYPFNPTTENRIQGAEGPQSGGITNNVPVEHLLLWEVELFHQGRYRRQGAAAALSRTEYEIAFQEQTLAVQVIRAYTTLLYQQEKLGLLEETVQFNQRLATDLRRLQRPAADVYLAETEVTATMGLVNAGRELVTVARSDLARLLGVVGGGFDIDGKLDIAPQPWDQAALTALALTRRADLNGRREAVTEAAAITRLVRANRWGNPTVGPIYTYDPSGVNSFGIQFNVPLPVVNTHRGEILQSEAEQAQAVYLLRQAEVNVRQDVAAALARLKVVEQRAEFYRSKALPELRKVLDTMEDLYKNNQPSADFFRVMDIRRKLLQARDGYLDALLAVRQARADLLAATGEPALGLSAAPPQPAKP